MRHGRKPLKLVLLVGLMVLSVSKPVPAIDISGRSSTYFDWYDGVFKDETALDFYEYLSLNLTNITPSNFFTVHAYGRFADNMSTSETDYYDLQDPATVNSKGWRAKQVRSDEWLAESRLYYLFVDVPNIKDRVDIRLGRQFVFSTSGNAIIDGVHLQVRNLGPVNVRLWGGGDVSFFKEYDSENTAFGLGIGVNALKFADFGFSYLMKYDLGDLSRQSAGMNVDISLPFNIKLYADLQYDLLSAFLNSAEAGIRFHASEKWTVSADYYSNTPVFDSTSIYSVFACDDIEEISLRAACQFTRNASVFGRLGIEQYESFDNTQFGEIGANLTNSDWVDVYAGILIRNGEDTLQGGKLVLSRSYKEFVTASLAAEVDQYERVTDVTGQKVAQRYWADVDFRLMDNLHISLLLENSRSDEIGSLFRSRARLIFTF